MTMLSADNLHCNSIFVNALTIFSRCFRATCITTSTTTFSRYIMKRRQHATKCCRATSITTSTTTDLLTSLYQSIEFCRATSITTSTTTPSFLTGICLDSKVAEQPRSQQALQPKRSRALAFYLYEHFQIIHRWWFCSIYLSTSCLKYWCF